MYVLSLLYKLGKDDSIQILLFSSVAYLYKWYGNDIWNTKHVKTLKCTKLTLLFKEFWYYYAY